MKTNHSRRVRDRRGTLGPGGHQGTSRGRHSPSCSRAISRWCARESASYLPRTRWPDAFPELHQKCHEGPLWDIQYRLRGPGARPETAHRILLEKTPVPYKSSVVLRALYTTLLWLRKVLPVKPESKPRFV